MNKGILCYIMLNNSKYYIAGKANWHLQHFVEVKIYCYNSIENY